MLTAVASVHVCDQGRTEWVEVSNHFGLLTHVMELGYAKVGLAQARSGGSGSGLVPCQLMLVFDA